MKFFKKSILDDSSLVFEKAKKQYWDHVERIRLGIPSRLYHLHKFYSLHDGLIRTVVQLRGDKDVGVIIEGFANGMVGNTDRCIFFLHFIGCSEFYVDQERPEIDVVEICEKGDRFMMEILSRNDELEYAESFFVFSDFDFYLFDSRSPK